MQNPMWRWGLPLLPSSEQKSLQTSRPHEGLGEGRVVTQQPQFCYWTRAGAISVLPESFEIKVRGQDVLEDFHLSNFSYIF